MVGPDVGAVVAPGATDVAERLIERWPAARAFVLVGCASITAGGVIAAVSRPAGLERGPWLAAYLVLVGGVAQIALGAGQAWMSAEPPGPRAVRRDVGAWNLGLAATVIGSLASMPIVTTVGGVATILALSLFLWGVRRCGTTRRWLLASYRCLVVLVLVSTPVGVALSWIRGR